MPQSLKQSLPGKVWDEISTKKYAGKPYQSDGGFEMSGALALTAILLVTSAVVGMAAHFISQWLYLIILFPLVMGGAIGFLGAKVCTAQKIRNPWLGGGVGILAGFFAMGTMHYLDYRANVSAFAEVQSDFKPLFEAPPAQQEQMIESLDTSPSQKQGVRDLLEFSKVHSFLDFMNYRAREGVRISRHVGASGLNLGFYGSYLYWLAEILVVAGVCFWMVREACAAPFCSHCSSWKKIDGMGQLPYIPGDRTSLDDALGAGDLAAWVEWLDAGVNHLSAERERLGADYLKLKNRVFHGHFRFELAACEKCHLSSPVDLKVEQASVNSKGNLDLKRVAHLSYSPDARAPLKSIFSAAT